MSWTEEEYKQVQARRRQAWQELFDAMSRFWASEAMNVHIDDDELKALAFVFGMAARRVVLARSQEGA